jgi:hypothetical protein
MLHLWSLSGGESEYKRCRGLRKRGDVFGKKLWLQNGARAPMESNEQVGDQVGATAKAPGL